MMGVVNRPFLYRMGGLALGALCGLQVGLWRMQRAYKRVDPDGTIRAELEQLFKAVRGNGPCPARKEKQSTNEYGDKFE